MFYLIKKKLKIIAVSNTFSRVNVQNILHPSELTDDWFVRTKSSEKIQTDFLYVGRFKKEKGIYYLIKIFKEYFSQYQLTIAGTEKKLIDKKYLNKNIHYIGPVIRSQDLIDLYDSSRIFILPSYTEGFPKVISEALARLKPIIIFEEIKHVVYGRKGIFVCKRNEKNIRETINYILKNYKEIQKKIIENKFYTKNDFKTELLNTIKDEFSN
jgi:glycosyltransferase involved in cell wall biosynthesis